MKVTVFTGNQPRHLSLIASLAEVFDEVFAVQECSTVFPGQVEDFFRKSAVMQDYFSRVIAAEDEVFGGIRFLPGNVRTLSLKMGDLNKVALDRLAPALDVDLVVVFGASYIRAPLIDVLVERRAVNIHMGVSPYYRGSSCNFWALYDGNPDLVGATIHMLSRGLDSGAMLFHALPQPQACDPFVLGMRAVKAAHVSLVAEVASGNIFSFEPVIQDKSQEIRYTRNADFTDAVAAEYLARNLDAAWVGQRMAERVPRQLLRPRYV
ncbi:MAG: formyltransferase family protein [Actinomycetota bacterium]